jgi:hypothetical protein
MRRSNIDIGGMNNILLKAIYFFIIMVVILGQANGKVGYDIYAVVNNSNASSSFGWSHYTTVLSYNLVSSIKGDGNSSQYTKINGFDNINLKENTYTKSGRLKEDKRLSIASQVNWVYIDEDVTDNPEAYRVMINESMPSSLMNVEQIAYRGEGIYKRNSYVNNNDEMATDYQAKKFSEDSAFLGIYRNAFIYAEVTPIRVERFLGENYSTAFQVSSDSDLYSGFKFKSSDDLIDERYVGSFKLNAKVSRVHSFEWSPTDDDWLGCCPTGYEGLDYSLQAAKLCLCRSALIDFNQGIK